MQKKIAQYISFIIIFIFIFGFTAITATATQISSFSLNLRTQSQNTGTITGEITASESGKPLVHGKISLANNHGEINNGQFTLNDIPLGEHQITVKGPFRQTSTESITIKPGKNHINIAVDSIFDQEEIEMLARITRAEAEGESTKGRVAVAATVLNRVLSPRYPESITSVVYQRINGRYQYSPVADDRINLAPRIQDYQAAYQALAGYDPSNGATGFFNPSRTNDQWVRSHPVTTVIDDHTFFSY